MTDGGGPADATLRTHASSALAAAFAESGVGGGYLSVTGRDAVVNAARLCEANAGSSALYVGTLAVSDGTTQSIALDVTAYDCTGKAIDTRHDVEAWSRGVSLSKAIDVAAKKLATAFVVGK
ncbi:MAG: hypothetical protein IAI49_08205 [Candidatus Eremiobacteraeota bacterium]|nr:hypothetical protein [Candidatus Eremiobacteraeota bacterium]